MGDLGIIIVFVACVFVIGIILIFNTCMSMRNKVKQSKSTIDIYLTQRFDLIPNLVECVKAYKKYEETSLTAIIELRDMYNSTKSMQTANNLGNKMNLLLAQVEEIAELKASEQFMILQKSLAKIESQLQAARRIYNGDVTLYNTTIQIFPNNIIASIFKMEPEELFVIDEYKAQNIEVEV